MATNPRSFLVVVGSSPSLDQPAINWLNGGGHPDGRARAAADLYRLANPGLYDQALGATTGTDVVDALFEATVDDRIDGTRGRKLFAAATALEVLGDEGGVELLKTLYDEATSPRELHGNEFVAEAPDGSAQLFG